MIYNNRNYPHPILGINDDFRTATISVELSVSSDRNIIEVRPLFILENKDVRDLIDQTKASYVSHVYCRGTMFREIFRTTHNLSEPIRIPASKLNGEVEIDFFICSNQKIIDYKNDDFNQEYGNTRFSLEKADIIAFAGKGKFYANKSPEELKAISSIMNVLCTQKSNKPMSLDFSGNRITLMLCKEDYGNYKLLKNNPECFGLILSSMVLPALIETLHFLTTEEAEEFREKPWSKILNNIKDKSKGTCLEIAQNILEMPLKRTLDSLMLNENL
ncbi:MAG TPA: hypothetical protein VK559_11795 [Ferruginibacter sp.]|nr:hypothetical protein [Ferruginibacter sp.]